MRDVPHEQLVSIRVPDHPAPLGLALLTFSHCRNRKQEVEREQVQTRVSFRLADPGLHRYLVWGLCVQEGDLQVSVLGVSGLSGVFVSTSGTLTWAPLWAAATTGLMRKTVLLLKTGRSEMDLNPPEEWAWL